MKKIVIERYEALIQRVMPKKFTDSTGAMGSQYESGSLIRC
ncbi:MAG: hypothetical protein Ct9H90mP27_3560 [Gammaproteobacteria bacterium]|nr:MAG: hypothetical protein Ct9H90mP27_3560 [Gammaproteobacteria bacterium]